MFFKFKIYIDVVVILLICLIVVYLIEDDFWSSVLFGGYIIGYGIFGVFG